MIFPNLFNQVTTINYVLAEDSEVSVKIFALNGKIVKTLLNEKQSKGFHSVSWKGLDYIGQNVASGIYFYRLKTNKIMQIRKMMLIR